MKYILIFLFALLCSVGYAQNPVSQYLGSPTTTVISRGALKADSSLILPQFPDTTAANRSPYIKFYPGNLIRVFNDIYMRNTTATKWELINGGGTGGNNFIDSLRKVGDSVFARKYGVFVYQYTDSAQKILANNGLSFSGDTLQLGGTLTQNTTITGTQKELKLDSIDFNVRDDSLNTRLFITNNNGFNGKSNELSVTYNKGFDGIFQVTHNNKIIQDIDNGNFISADGLRKEVKSYIRVDTGIIKIKVPDANLQIDGIQPPPLGAQFIRPLVYDAQTDIVHQWEFDSITALTKVNNGLSKSGDTIQLGGSLTKNTVIDQSNKIIDFNQAGEFNIKDTLLWDRLNINSVRSILQKGTGEQNPTNPFGYVQIEENEGGLSSSLLTNTFNNNDGYNNAAIAILSTNIGGSNAQVGTNTNEKTAVTNWNSRNDENPYIRNYVTSSESSSEIYMSIDSVLIKTGNGGYYIDNIAQTSDTLNSKPLVYNPTTRKVNFAPSYSGGNVLANNGLSKSVDTIQLGGTLTKNTTIIGNDKKVKIDSLRDFRISHSSMNEDTLYGYQKFENLIINDTVGVVSQDGEYFGIGGQVRQSSIRAVASSNSNIIAEMKVTSTGEGYASIQVKPNEINLNTNTNALNIDHLPTTFDTSSNKPMVWDATSKRVRTLFNYPTTDTTSLSNRINQKLNISDTASMLAPYFEAIDTVNLRRVKYVGLTMPSAFNVGGSPITDSGTIAVTGAGTVSQYVRGDGQLANFPSNGGGGSSVNYYLNGSVNQGTFGGATYYQLSKVPIIGAGTNFTRTNAQGNGYIASFITDAGDPSLLNIPGGNWNVEFYFNASSGGGNPSFYSEIYKVSATNVFTLVASGSTNPEGITQGTVVDQYFTSIPVPQTTLVATDRIAIRIFVTPSGRNITLHTEDNNLCEVLTTFSTGLNALNGLTAQVQYFATGTSGTDFNISSATDIHTFNLPTASATNRGALSSADWTTFNGKVSPSDTANKWITNVFRKNASDSVFFVRGGTNNFAFTDSAGAAVIQQTYTSGASVNCNNSTTWLIINPASLQSTLTVNLPSSPSANQDVLISFGGTLTTGVVVNTLTISPTPLQATTPKFIEVGESVGYRWNATNSKWYRVN